MTDKELVERFIDNLKDVPKSPEWAMSYHTAVSLAKAVDAEIERLRAEVTDMERSKDALRLMLSCEEGERDCCGEDDPGERWDGDQLTLLSRCASCTMMHYRKRAEAAERRWKYVLADFKTMTKAYGEEQDANRKLREATKRERERCAEIADSYCCKAECGGTQDADHHSQCWTADAIAAAIRGGE